MQLIGGHASAPGVGSVLIVDDSVVQRNHCAELCRDLGIARVLEANDGREALELLQGLETAPDLLIVDLEMPAMDGPELIARLRERELDIPIVVASSRDRSIVNSMQDRRAAETADGARAAGAAAASGNARGPRRS
jgi:CheY-like chemotaxis protein